MTLLLLFQSDTVVIPPEPTPEPQPIINFGGFRRNIKRLSPKVPEIIPIELHLPLESSVTVQLRERLPLRSFIYQKLRVVLGLESAIFSKIIENLPLRSTVTEETNAYTMLESIITNGPTITSLLIESNISRDKMDRIRSKLIDYLGEEYENS